MSDTLLHHPVSHNLTITHKPHHALHMNITANCDFIMFLLKEISNLCLQLVQMKWFESHTASFMIELIKLVQYRQSIKILTKGKD